MTLNYVGDLKTIEKPRTKFIRDVKRGQLFIMENNPLKFSYVRIKTDRDCESVMLENGIQWVWEANIKVILVTMDCGNFRKLKE